MNDKSFREHFARLPFAPVGDDEYRALAAWLLDSLSRHLGVALEFVGDRTPNDESFYPLVRSAEGLTSVGVRFGGMLQCRPYPREGPLDVSCLLFLFAAGRRLGPRGVSYLIFEYLGPDAEPAWADRGWEVAEFSDEWDPYTYERYFGGRESELPGCGGEA